MTLTVLLVDDNFDHRFLTRRALKAWEAEGRVRVVVAEDGEDAWEQLRAGLRPGLVLLDIKMPRRDGFELLRDLRGDDTLAGVPVVLFSSSESREDVERGRALGATSYVTKPLDARGFQEAVRAIVGSWLPRE